MFSVRGYDPHPDFSSKERFKKPLSLPTSMVTRLGGSRHKTRYKLQRPVRERGHLRLTQRLAKYTEGDKVALVIDSSVQHGLFYPRHHGKTGVVVGKQGNGYLVRVMDKNKAKTLITTAAHLKRVG
jgi:large subunit ribosomal protein L21e